MFDRVGTEVVFFNLCGVEIMDGSGTTRVYERGRTRLQTSSWIASAPKHQYCEGSGGGFVSDDDAQLHVLCDGVDYDGQCSVGKCASGQVLESNLLMPGGHVVPLAGVDDDTCGLNKFPVVRGNGCRFVQLLVFEKFFL